MPKLPAKDEKILRFYIQEGATEDKIPVVAKRFKLRESAVKKTLGLKRVREEMDKRLAPMRLEQDRQRLAGEAVAEVTAKLTAELAETRQRLEEATKMPVIDVPGNEHIIGQELMRLVRLDGEKYGGVKLAAIKTAYVVAGVMDMGTTRRTIPADPVNAGGAAGIYTSTFDRLRLESTAPAAPQPIDAPPQPEDGVYDLIPSEKPAPAPPPKEIKLPPPGESIGPVKNRVEANPRVLTIEV